MRDERGNRREKGGGRKEDKGERRVTTAGRMEMGCASTQKQPYLAKVLLQKGPNSE
jgi:hypothetical protein